MSEMDDILIADDAYEIREDVTGGGPDDMLISDPRYELDLPPQVVGTQGAAEYLPILREKQLVLEAKFFKTQEDWDEIEEIKKERNMLTVPMYQSDEFYRMIGEQSQGMQQAMTPIELFFGIASGQTIAKLGTTTLKGVLTRAIAIGGIAAATDIPIEIAAIAAEDVSPWLGVAVGIGLSIPMALYADSRIEERVFRISSWVANEMPSYSATA